jgi:hypothetical protein
MISTLLHYSINLDKLTMVLARHVFCGACAADAPGVTHIIHPFGPEGDPDDGNIYMRVQEFR